MLDYERALALIRQGKIKAIEEIKHKDSVCQRCPGSSLWESVGGKEVHCFSYALFQARGGKPKPCGEAIKGCKYKFNIEVLRKKYAY